MALVENRTRGFDMRKKKHSDLAQYGMPSNPVLELSRRGLSGMGQKVPRLIFFVWSRR